MIWTLFVKESQTLQDDLLKLATIFDKKQGDRDKERKTIIDEYLNSIKPSDNYKYSYDVIKNHIDKIAVMDTLEENEKKFIEAISKQYLRYSKEDWQKLTKWLEEIKEFYAPIGNTNPVDIYNFLTTKNHTPSRILNVWNLTKEFLGSIFNIEEIACLLQPFHRLQITLDGSVIDLLPKENVIYGAVFPTGERIDLVRQQDTIQVIIIRKDIDVINKIEKWHGKEITIKASEFDREVASVERIAKITGITQASSSTYPYRTITVSPDLFIALVPADKAVEISRIIYENYLFQFGKVVGRMPFSISNIFFKEKTPMFVVLDAARKAKQAFETLYKCDEATKRLWKVASATTNEITFVNGISWDRSSKLGDDEKEDFYHPYFIVESSINNEHKKRDTYFKTCEGDVIHFSEIKVGDSLRIYPNYYDFEFLDSTGRRFDLINENSEGKRRSSTTCAFTKPFFMDELEQKLCRLWELLKNRPEMTDTKLRNIESLWLTKMDEWKVDLCRTEETQTYIWRNFVETTLKKEFPRFRDLRTEIDKKDFEFLKESIFSGVFFDCLELNLRILKNRISNKEKEE